MNSEERNELAIVLKLARYGVDSFTTIYNKLDKLIETGLTFEDAVSELENYYQTFKPL